MASITLNGNAFSVAGVLPSVGSSAPNFTLTGSDLAPINLNQFSGKTLILNIFPSVDTGTCATSTRKFNEKINDLENVEVLCVSQDLPFAFARFCGAENLQNVTTGSTFRSPSFLTNYGVYINDGPLEGLCARAIVVIDTDQKVLHTELVSELSHEPDYDAALKFIK